MCSMCIEMQNPVQACLIIGPPILSSFDNPGRWKVALCVPIGKVIDPLQKDVWWYAPPSCINSLDYCCPFSITRLHSLWMSTSISTCNDHVCLDLAHHKPSLIKVVEIVICNTILGPHIHHKLKPILNHVLIFT